MKRLIASLLLCFTQLVLADPPEREAVSTTTPKSELMWVSVKDFGAVGDGMMVHDAVLNGTTTVTSATANWPASVEGKYVRVAGGTTAGTNQVETATAAGTINATTDSAPGVLAVTVTGTGISGTPVTFSVNVAEGDTAATWAGKVRNYLSNALNLFDLYYVGGSSTAITLTGKRPRANDATLNIAIAAGSNLTGFSTISTSANTTAGVATVDLITTVASRTNATTVVLEDAAGRSGGSVTMYYGTDDTEAIEAAIERAETSGIRRVLFPQPVAGGCYLCNITGRPHIALEGADGGLTEFEFDPPGPPLPDLSDRDIVPVALLPAVATSPVISYPGSGKIYGGSIKKLAIFGSKEQVGVGIQIGEQNNSGSIFAGGGFRMDQVLVTGFEYGFSGSKVSQIQADNCLFLYSRVCVFAGQLGLAVGPIDTSVFNSCGTGGDNCDAGWFISACKGVLINGGDHNDSDHVAVILNGSTVAMSGFNSENTQASPYVLATGRLTLNGANFLHLRGPLIDQIGSDNEATVNDCRFGTVESNALWQGKAIYHRTDQSTGYLNKLPRGGVMVRYPEFGWNTLMVAEYTSEIYSNPAVDDRRPRIFDEFVAGYAASPYSQLGWTITAVAGSTPIVGTPSQPTYPGNQFGLIYLTPNGSSASNIMRFSLPIESFNTRSSSAASGASSTWRMRWRLALISSSTVRLRVGLYSNDGLAGDLAIPKNGIGIKIDRSTPDANLMFEVINNEVSTAVDTGIPYTALDSAKEIQIWRTAEGLFFGLYPTPNAGAGILYPMVEHSPLVVNGTHGTVSDYLAPNLTMGTSTTGAPQALIDHFSLKLFENEFN